MSKLRRLAQTNNASNHSPNYSDASSQASPATPVKGNGHLPTTPRTQLVYPISPLTSPSLSASLPFDWEAARARRPPPYDSPLRRVRRPHSPSHRTPAKRIVRKKTLYEKITSIPSRVAFEISIFPNNVPLPTPQKSAWIIGGLFHFLHLCVRISQTRSVPESDLGWEDMYREDEGQPWFDWTIPVSIFLITASILNAMSTFTRTKIYQLNLAKDPVASPHAKFVPRASRPSSRSSTPPTPSSKTKRLASVLLNIVQYFWRAFIVSMRFLLNLNPPTNANARQMANVWGGERVQELDVWNPGELELILLVVYSPVHAFLWMATNTSNWIVMLIIMGVLSIQLQVLTLSYQGLLKDKAIISAEVMHEYNEKFVYPRVNPIRKDAAVMTHEAEMVDLREEYRPKFPRRFGR